MRWRWVALLAGIGFGAFAAFQYWPYVDSLLKRPRPEQRATSSAELTPGPTTVVPEPIMGDPKLAVLGTESSTSVKPLPLVLVGTMPGRNVSEGTAMIGTDVRNAQTYLAGAILHNGARLTEVHRDRVVLTLGDRRADLYLQSRGTGEGTKQIASDPILTVGGTPVESTARKSAPPSSIDTVSDYIRAVPVYRDGVVAGFEVFPGSHRSVFSKWGLKPGDVVTSLDGAALVDADQTQQLLSALNEGAALNASIQRADGSRVQVALNGADVVQLNAARTEPSLAAQVPIR